MAQYLTVGRLATIGGVVGAAALTGVSMHFAYQSVVDPLPFDRLAVSPRSVPPVTVEQMLASEPSAPFKATVLAGKPLFIPGRAPPAAAVPPPPPVVSKPEPPPPRPPAYVVSGIVISTAVRRVLLRTDAAGGQWVSQGEVTKEGWTVALVEPDRVVLRHGRREISLVPPGRNPGKAEHIAAR